MSKEVTNCMKSGSDNLLTNPFMFQEQKEKEGKWLEELLLVPCSVLITSVCKHCDCVVSLLRP